MQPEKVKASTRETFLKGVRDSMPIVVAFFFIFLSVGALSNQHHLSIVQAICMTIFVFAAPFQAILLQMTHQEWIFLTAIFGAFIVNFRFFMMSTALLPYFKDESLLKILLMIPMLSASTFAVSYTKFKNEDQFNHFYYYFGVAFTSYFFAILSTGLGYLVAKDLDSGYLMLLISMVLPIHFSALTALNWPKLLPILATLLGFLCTPLVNIAFPKLGLLLGPMLAGCITFIAVSHIKKRNSTLIQKGKT